MYVFVVIRSPLYKEVHVAAACVQVGKDLSTKCAYWCDKTRWWWFVSLAMFLIHGSLLYCWQHVFFSLKFSPAVKPIQFFLMEVAPCMTALNVTPGHKSHLSWYRITRWILQGSSLVYFLTIRKANPVFWWTFLYPIIRMGPTVFDLKNSSSNCYYWYYNV